MSHLVVPKIEYVEVEDDYGRREVLTKNYPTIEINGKELGGMECWWYPIDEERK